MHSARLLTVSPSMHCARGGGLLAGGGVCLPCEQNHRRLWKYNLAPTSLRAVKIAGYMRLGRLCSELDTNLSNSVWTLNLKQRWHHFFDLNTAGQTNHLKCLKRNKGYWREKRNFSRIAIILHLWNDDKVQSILWLHSVLLVQHHPVVLSPPLRDFSFC